MESRGIWPGLAIPALLLAGNTALNSLVGCSLPCIFFLLQFILFTIVFKIFLNH
ncbi:MAG: hypothetical protein ACTSRP_24525 [Candidatus Helarchaeota archaeon]